MEAIKRKEQIQTITSTFLADLKTYKVEVHDPSHAVYKPLWAKCLAAIQAA